MINSTVIHVKKEYASPHDGGCCEKLEVIN